MKRNSIVFSLAAVILTILILFAAMITYRIYVIGSSQLIAEQEFSYSTIVADRRFQLRRELERLSDVIELMATNSLAEISTDDLQGKDRLLADIADMPLTAWKALFITDSRGMITSSTDPEFLRKDIGTSPYYQFLMNNRTNRTRLSYIPTSAIDTGLGFINHVFATRFTCRESGESGLLVGVFDFNQYDSTMGYFNRTYGLTGYGEVIGLDGTILTSKFKENIGSFRSEEKALIDSYERIASAFPFAFPRQMNRVFRTKTVINGSLSRIFMTKIAAPYNHYYLIIIPETDFYQKINSMMQSIIRLSVITALIAFLALVLYVNFMIVRRLRKFEYAFGLLGAGDFTHELVIKGNDEVHRLAQGYIVLVSRLKDLVEQIENKTRDIQAILDNTGQGFFSFGSDLVIDENISRWCTDTFGFDIAGKHVEEILCETDAQRSELRQGLSLIFSGQADPRVIFDFLDHSMRLGDLTISIEWKQHGEDKVLCVLTDISESVQIENAKVAEERKRALLFKVINNKRYFASFIHEMNAYFEAMEKTPGEDQFPEPVSDIIKKTHTIKGNSGFFGFVKTQECAHNLEITLSDYLVLGGSLDFQGRFDNLRRVFAEELEIVNQSLGKDWIESADSVQIPRKEYSAVLRSVMSILTPEDPLVSVMNKYRMIPIQEVLSRFVYITESTALKLAKRINPVKTASSGGLLLVEGLEAFLDSCVHILNNMIDHGLESAAQREQAGKTPEGNIEIGIQVTDIGYKFSFRDDGRGINIASIEESARRKGLISAKAHLTAKEALMLIFSEGFTTKDKATLISGRGIGLAAVRSEVLALKGTISVRTHLGDGTEFMIFIPRRIE